MCYTVANRLCRKVNGTSRVMLAVWDLGTAEPVEDEVQGDTGGVEAGPSVHHGTTDGCGRDGLRVQLFAARS